MDFKQYLKKQRELVNKALDGYFEFSANVPPIIRKAMRYSIFAGGKRLRPILALEGAEIFEKGGYKKALGVACALEMIHTYSLIHDDLPAMDNDDYRRNKPTCHKKFGEAIAILAGDALLTYAFWVLSTNIYVTKEIIKIMAESAGVEGMIGGQIADIQHSKYNIEDLKSKSKKEKLTKQMKEIHKHKTGALIKASLKMGALCVGAPKSKIQLLEEYGDNIGLAFQIADDVLDVIGDKKKLGKRGSDEQNEKLTYPVIYGIEKSKRKAKELVEKALSNLTVFGTKANILKRLACYIVERDY